MHIWIIKEKWKKKRITQKKKILLGEIDYFRLKEKEQGASGVKYKEVPYWHWNQLGIANDQTWDTNGLKTHIIQ
jgi:hypothetical protein